MENQFQDREISRNIHRRSERLQPDVIYSPSKCIKWNQPSNI